MTPQKQTPKECHKIDTRRLIFITHGEVRIDPAVPVPEWGLSEVGVRRHRAFNAAGPVGTIGAIYCSGERKAIDAAAILAEAVGAPPRIVESLHENDRSATGFLPPAEFQATADLFFAHPNDSIRGWERAADAQARIVAAVAAIITQDRSGDDIAVVAHGGVGALLLCHVLGAAISRQYDQPGSGGGNYFMFDARSWALEQGWRDIANSFGTAGEARL